MQVAALAQRFPGVPFLLGRSGATDFGRDGAECRVKAVGGNNCK